MKSGIRDIVLIVVSIVLALIIVPFILKLAGELIKIIIIVVIAYILFIASKQLLK